MPVAEREFLSQVVIKRDLILVVEVDGLIVGRTLHTVVWLLGLIVHTDESIAQALPQGVHRVRVVILSMRGKPGVIQVRSNASSGVVKREDLATVIVKIGVEAM